MANLSNRYESVRLVVSLRPDESEYLVCAVIDGAEVPFAALSIARVNKYLDLRGPQQQPQASAPEPQQPTGDQQQPPQQ